MSKAAVIFWSQTGNTEQISRRHKCVQHIFTTKNN